MTNREDQILKRFWDDVDQLTLQAASDKIEPLNICAVHSKNLMEVFFASHEMTHSEVYHYMYKIISSLCIYLSLHSKLTVLEIEDAISQAIEMADIESIFRRTEIKKDIRSTIKHKKKKHD